MPVREGSVRMRERMQWRRKKRMNRQRAQRTYFLARYLLLFKRSTMDILHTLRCYSVTLACASRSRWSTSTRHPHSSRFLVVCLVAHCCPTGSTPRVHRANRANHSQSRLSFSLSLSWHRQQPVSRFALRHLRPYSSVRVAFQLPDLRPNATRKYGIPTLTACPSLPSWLPCQKNYLPILSQGHIPFEDDPLVTIAYS